jgi:hypothetical protein
MVDAAKLSIPHHDQIHVLITETTLKIVHEPLGTHGQV